METLEQHENLNPKERIKKLIKEIEDNLRFLIERSGTKGGDEGVARGNMYKKLIEIEKVLEEI